MKYRLSLSIVGFLSTLAAIAGLAFTVMGQASELCPSFWVLGIFTWDDGVTIGLVMAVTAWYLYWRSSRENLEIRTGLIFSLYGAIRMAGEAKYNMDAQFSPISRPWEAGLPHVAAMLHLKLVELFVVAQDLYMCAAAALGMIFVWYLRRYWRGQ